MEFKGELSEDKENKAVRDICEHMRKYNLRKYAFSCDELLLSSLI